MSFEFISNGGCALCDAMAGYYDEEPSRPHPNCRCQIIAVDAPTFAGGVLHNYWVDYLYREHIGDPNIWFIDHWEIVLECCGVGDSGTFQEAFDFEIPRHDDLETREEWFEEQLERFEQEKNAIIEGLMQQCPDPGCTFV